MTDYTTELQATDRSVYVAATYPAVPWACPENVTVTVPIEEDRADTAAAIYAAVDALARVPAYAQLAREDAARVMEGRR